MSPSEETSARARRLLARVAVGDRDALATLYDDTAAQVYRLARLLTGDERGADELTRATYLRVWGEAPRYDPTALSPIGWLLALTRASSRDALRAA